MRLSVSPTRMELLRLRHRLELAIRGHKLLKDKEEELVDAFLKLIAEHKDFRDSLEEKFLKSAENFFLIQAETEEEFLEEELFNPQISSFVEASIRPYLNIKSPSLTLKKEGEIILSPFSKRGLREVIEEYQDLLPSLIKLAELERKIELFAFEIERTRRRVNALEKVLIPNLEETISYIEMKLEELERSNLVRLKRVKELLAS